MDVIVDRCAGLDVHKKTVMACVRKWGEDHERVSLRREFSTFTYGLRELRAWLASEGVTQVAMEATGIFWRPVWYVLEDMKGVELLLANAQHVKNVPGRKTDAKDAEWLAQLLECGLLRGSFIPIPVMQRLRDLTRYRNKLVEDRAREVQRVQNVLEDAGIKLDSVISDVMGKSSRQMLEALIAGERRPEVLAELSKARMRAKIPDLQLALVGRFGEHHALMARMHLDHIDHLDELIDRLDQEVDKEMVPFAQPAARLMTVPGIGKISAEVIIAEIGTDMSRFPTAAHLASWAGMCPGNHESAGKSRSGRHRKGNEALQSVLCEVAWAASHTKDTYLAAQHKQFHRRFGKKGATKATFALGHTILVIIWNILSKEGAVYQELGSTYLEQRRDNQAEQQRLIRKLERMGLKVTVERAA